MPLGVELICREVARGARYGLFHGVPMRHGFQVSKRGKNKSAPDPFSASRGTCRTKRTWKPNIQSVYLYSEALDRRIQLQVTTTALRQIDFHGGLDNYLSYTPERLRRSIVAEELRKEILAKRGPPKPPPSERFYIEKILKPEGKVAWEMVSELTGQRFDKHTKAELPSQPAHSDVKTIPQPTPMSLEALRRKYR